MTKSLSPTQRLYELAMSEGAERREASARSTPNMAVNQNSSQNAWLRKYLYITAISSQRDYLLVLRNKKVLCPVCGKTSAIFSIQGLHATTLL